MEQGWDESKSGRIGRARQAAVVNLMRDDGGWNKGSEKARDILDLFPLETGLSDGLNGHKGR